MSLDSRRRRQYSESQRRRCTQIIQVIVGDDDQPNGAYGKDLIEGISTIRRPSLIALSPPEPYVEPLPSPAISARASQSKHSRSGVSGSTIRHPSLIALDPPEPYVEPLRSPAISARASQSKLSRSGVSGTTYDGASVRSQSSVPGHLYASSVSSGSRPGLSPRLSRSVNDASLSTSHRSSQYFSTGTDPPRQAKDGYEWVWFPEGYWAEREIVGFATMSKWARRAANESRASYESSAVGPGVPGTARSESNAQWQHPTTATGSPTEKSTKKNKARPKLSRRPTGSTSSILSVKEAVLNKLSIISPFKTPDGSSEPSEGLYCKTMRVLGGEGGRRKVRREVI